MNCKKCGQEVDKKAVVCTQCGCKIKKPIYKKWWFWFILIIAAIAIISSSGNNNSTPTNDASPQGQEEIVYESVDLQTMFDDLESNAMKAESNYKDKYVEFECKIKSFDSDGSYVSVEPVGADEWNFSSAMCYIKNDTQKEFLLQKNVGDTITIKGRIKSIGEVLGYSVDIKEVI